MIFNIVVRAAGTMGTLLGTQFSDLVCRVQRPNSCSSCCVETSNGFIVSAIL